MPGYVWLAIIVVVIVLVAARMSRQKSAVLELQPREAEEFREVFERRIEQQEYRPPAAPIGITFTVSSDPADDNIDVTEDLAGPYDVDDDADVKVYLGVRAIGGGYEKRARDTIVGIKYIDARGAETVRDISVQQFNDVYLGAWCFERQRPRTFRWDRIAAAFDAKTGEIIPDLHGLLRDIAARSEQWKPLWPVVRRGLRILAYIAHCDGHVHPAEREVMISYVKAALAATKNAPAATEDVIAMLVEQTERTLPAPESVQDSLDGISKLSRNSTRCRIIADHAIRLVEADGDIAPVEEIMVAGLRDWIRRIDEKKPKSRRSRTRERAAA